MNKKETRYSFNANTTFAAYEEKTITLTYGLQITDIICLFHKTPGAGKKVQLYSVSYSGNVVTIIFKNMFNGSTREAYSALCTISGY